jgi:N-acyl-D-aspartate/D-glutamate deacylase
LWFDLIIENGFVIDGTGNPWFRADIGVKDGKITDIGDLKSLGASRVIDIKNLFISPGFVDIHTHSDTVLLLAPRCDSHVMQGVTTICVGNCGSSPYPITEKNREVIRKRISRRSDWADMQLDWSTLDGYIRKIESQGVSVNVAPLVGHGTVRAAVIGMEDRSPKSGELEEMKFLVDESMRDGSFGLSSGLDYLPGCFAETDEVIELAKVSARYGGLYASHIREQNLYSHAKAVKELLKIGEMSGARIHCAHCRPVYPNWGQEETNIKRWDEARARGIDVTADIIFPQLIRSRLSRIIPPWWRALHDNDEQKQREKTEKLIEDLKDLETRNKIKEETLTVDWYGSDREKTGEIPNFNHLVKGGFWGDIKLCSLYKKKMLRNEKYIGKSIAEIAKIRGVEPFDALCELIIEEKDNVYGLGPGVRYSSNITLIRHPVVMAASDSSCKAATKPWTDEWAQPQRDYGPYAYLLGTWVRKEHIIPLEEMIRKMTSLPARTLGLNDRGLIVKGMYADLVIFNKDTIEDKSTHDDPHQYPEGVEYVIVNGELVKEDNKHTDRLPGKVLRHSP